MGIWRKKYICIKDKGMRSKEGEISVKIEEDIGWIKTGSKAVVSKI